MNLSELFQSKVFRTIESYVHNRYITNSLKSSITWELSHYWQTKSFIHLGVSRFLTGRFFGPFWDGLSGRGRLCLGILLNSNNWILLKNNPFLGRVGCYWRSWQLSFCSTPLSSLVHVTSILHFALASGIIDDNCISILVSLNMVQVRMLVTTYFLGCDRRSRIRSPSVLTVSLLTFMASLLR